MHVDTLCVDHVSACPSHVQVMENTSLSNMVKLSPAHTCASHITPAFVHWQYETIPIAHISSVNFNLLLQSSKANF